MITPTPPKPRQRAHTPSEATIQQKCVSWLWNAHPETRGLYFCVPNENTQSQYENSLAAKISGARRKMMGVISGVSDTILFVPRGTFHAACFEYKTATGSQSENQKIWQRQVEELGYYYCVIRSLEQFQEQINWYLSL